MKLSLDCSFFGGTGFLKLIELVGNKYIAKGLFVEILQASKIWYLPDKKPIPMHYFETIFHEHIDVLVSSGIMTSTTDGYHLNFADIYFSTELKTLAARTAKLNPNKVIPKKPKSEPVCKSYPLKEIWNANCGNLPKVTTMSAARKRHDVNLYTEFSDSNYWIDVVRRIAKSDFCNGKNDRGWQANFDFLLRPNTHIKTMEGAYDNKAQKDSKDPINWDRVFGRKGQ